MENNNSVCFVAKINEIKAIPGADNIEQAIIGVEQAVIGGWSCIVKKGAHTVDDKVMVATTDAIIHDVLARRLGVENYLRKGGRVRTIKLRGVYSECLIIPMTMALSSKYDAAVGTDMMEHMKVFKYEPPIKQIQLASGRKVKWRDNQNFHIYYKFPNLKNVPGMFTNEDTVEITRKLHGTNARFGIVKKSKLSILDRIKKLFGNKWIDYEFVVGSHNTEKGSDSNGYYDTNVWYEICNRYDIKNKLWAYVKSDIMNRNLGDGLIIYGEIYGAGIQKGYDYGLNDIKFAGFDAKENNEYHSPINAKLLIVDILGLPYVPILHFGNWSQEKQDSFVFNNFIPGTKTPEEGIVIKYHTGERQKVAKVINPDYLIYAEKHNVEDSH